MTRRPLMLSAKLYGGTSRLVLVAALAFLAAGCVDLRRTIVRFFSANADSPSSADKLLSGTFTDKDTRRPRIEARLRLIADVLPMVTDIQAIPAVSALSIKGTELLVLTKGGDAFVLDSESGTTRKLFSVPVRTDSEEGLLGVAFHPNFAKNHRFFVNYTPKGNSMTRIAAWEWPKGATPRETKVLLEVEQPYQNHNAGQLAFGPDGYLYVGFGDGGWANDPHGHGQNLKTYLGAMLRLDVDKTEGQRPYAIPADNPFRRRQDALPEIWAYGLRNPWRYMFAPDGRLVVADVGQNKQEEVSIIRAGENGGWAVMEGRLCHAPAKGCKRDGLKLPFVVYERDDGQSITGGYVVIGDDVPALKGKYVFGDFASGRIWAVTLPADDQALIADQDMHALGSFGINVSTFGLDQKGRLYVGAFDRGAVYRVEAAAR